MTEQQTSIDQQVIHADAPVIVQAQAGSRLEHLQSQYQAAKDARDAAEARFKDISDGIKAELAAAAPDRVKVELPAGAGPALQLQFTERWTFDSKKLKADDPLMYVRYAKKGGAWSLRPVSS